MTGVSWKPKEEIGLGTGESQNQAVLPFCFSRALYPCVLQCLFLIQSTLLKIVTSNFQVYTVQIQPAKSIYSISCFPEKELWPYILSSTSPHLSFSQKDGILSYGLDFQEPTPLHRWEERGSSQLNGFSYMTAGKRVFGKGVDYMWPVVFSLVRCPSRIVGCTCLGWGLFWLQDRVKEVWLPKWPAGIREL